MRNNLLLALFLISGFCSYGQKVSSVIDTTRNKIGAQFNFTITATADTSATVIFPGGDNFGKLNVIRSYVIDTVKNGGQRDLIKRYGLTQFDSGKYVLPRLAVVINGKKVYTDSLQLEVTPVVVDTLKQKMFEIKPILEPDTKGFEWWWYILGIVLLTAVCAAIYFLRKKRYKKSEPVYKSPIEKATSLLKTLETKQLWQRGEIKSYYSELTDIARTYIEEEIHIPAMESTTTELIKGLRAVSAKKKMKLSKETLQDLESVLMQADLVKFAKSKPMDFEIEQDKTRIEKTIVLIHKAVPEEVTDEGDNSLDLLMKEKLRRKKKRLQIIYGIVGFILAFFFTIVILIATKGMSYLRDNFLGHPTKELLETEWVSSEYGNPGVFIETPKVLKRTDISKAMPKEGMALIRDMQTFTYGSIVDDFYIVVSTYTFRQEVEIDLQKSIDGSLQMLEAGGAQNMIVKQEEFRTDEGISGRKGYGTFSRIDPIRKQSTKCYYEIMVFGQQNGLQQIIILHREDDNYGKQISERVLNSVELKQAMP